MYVQYEGYANYPTFIVAHILNNVPLWNERWEYFTHTVKASTDRTDSEKVAKLANLLRDYVESRIESRYVIQESASTANVLARDLLGWSIGQVDWHEIAKSELGIA